MCEICAGRGGDRCSGNDPYANYDGAFRCLEKDGEIAFLKHTTIHEATLDNPALKSRQVPVLHVNKRDTCIRKGNLRRIEWVVKAVNDQNDELDAIDGKQARTCCFSLM